MFPEGEKRTPAKRDITSEIPKGEVKKASKKIGPNDDLIIEIKLTDEEKENKTLVKGRKTSYTVKGSERDSIHVELENVTYVNAKKVSVPQVAIYEPNIWHGIIRKNILNNGYSHVRILYAPKGVNVDLTKK